MPMLTIVIALALLAQTSSTVGQQPAFVVGEKVAGSVGFYNAQFKRLRSVKVGVHPHEMWLSADKRTLYVADNGVLWMTETGPGENTVSTRCRKDDPSDSPISKAVRRFSKSSWLGDRSRSRSPRTGGWPIARFRKRTRSTSSPFRNGRSRASTTHRKGPDPIP
jgi:hypothetical protein